MRIAINAGILHGPVTGIANYLLAIIRKLSEHNQHTFFLYVLHEDDLALIADAIGKNVVVRSSNIKSKFGKKAWEQLVLPFWSHYDNIDVFWSPSHHLPIFLPTKIKKVVTVHDLVWKILPRTMTFFNRLAESLLMPLSLRVSNMVIAVSNSTANDIKKYWPLLNKKVKVLYPVFDIRKVTFSDEAGKGWCSGNYLLFVGTLEPRKNLINLLKAYLRLPSQLQDSNELFIVGGQGWGDNAEITSLIHKGHSNIHWLGYISDKDLASLYAKASLFIMPSFYEGFGLPLVEAMSCGIPTITSDCSSMSEVVKAAALKVDPHDIGSIHDAMLKVLSNTELQESLKIKSKIRAKEVIAEGCVGKLIEVFEKLD